MGFLSVFNFVGMAFAAVLVLPNVFLLRSYPFDRERVPNKAMLLLARIGKFGSLLLMSVHLGVLEQGFTEPKELMQRFWWIATSVILAVYLLLFMLLFRSENPRIRRALAVLAAAVLIFCGILQVNTLLFTFGFVCLIGELYILHFL